MNNETKNAGDGPAERRVGRPIGCPVPEHSESAARREAKHQYLRELRELQDLAQGAPYVTDAWVRQVACMDEMEMRRRLIRSYDWSGHFHHSLDGIPEIRNIGGGGVDGCRGHKEVRAIVLDLLRQIERLKPPNTEVQRRP